MLNGAHKREKGKGKTQKKLAKSSGGGPGKTGDNKMGTQNTKQRTLEKICQSTLRPSRSGSANIHI